MKIFKALRFAIFLELDCLVLWRVDRSSGTCLGRIARSEIEREGVLHTFLTPIKGGDLILVVNASESLTASFEAHSATLKSDTAMFYEAERYFPITAESMWLTWERMDANSCFAIATKARAVEQILAVASSLNIRQFSCIPSIMGIVPIAVRESKNLLSVDILMPDHLESVSISNRKVCNWLVLPKHPEFESSNNLLLAYGSLEEAQSATCKNISNLGFASLQFRPIPNRVSVPRDAAFEAWYLVGVMALVFLLTTSAVLLMRAEDYRKLSGMIEEQTRELSKTAFPEKTRVREFDRELESANRSAQDLLAKLGEIGLQQPVAITLQRFLATCPELPSIRYSEIRFSNDTVMIFGDSDDLSSVRLLIDDLRRQNVAVKEEQYGNKFELRIQFPPDNNEVSNTVRM